METVYRLYAFDMQPQGEAGGIGCACNTLATLASRLRGQDSLVGTAGLADLPELSICTSPDNCPPSSITSLPYLILPETLPLEKMVSFSATVRSPSNSPWISPESTWAAPLNAP